MKKIIASLLILVLFTCCSNISNKELVTIKSVNDQVTSGEMIKFDIESEVAIDQVKSFLVGSDGITYETYNGVLENNQFTINRFLNTKNPKFLFWSIEKDSNVLMDPFCVEPINYWRGLLIESNSREDKEILAQLLVNIGIALGEYKNSSKSMNAIQRHCDLTCRIQCVYAPR